MYISRFGMVTGKSVRHRVFVSNILKLKYLNVGQIHMNFILNILGEEPVFKELEMDVIF